MLHFIEGKLVSLTCDVLTLSIEKIPFSMQEHVVGVPSSWLRLLQKVSRVVLCYREDVAEVVVVDEAEEPP